MTSVEAAARAGRVLLLWNAPNLDMALSTILGDRPTSANRPRFDAIGRWLVRRAGAEAVPEATVFTNISAGGAEFARPWVDALRYAGFAVFAKPKSTPESDIDDDMLAHLELRYGEGDLREAIVASGDGRAFREPLERLGSDGVAVTVLGFRERAMFAVLSDVIEFVDLEDIDGVFREALPRVRLEALPPEGAWLPPLRPLSALL